MKHVKFSIIISFLLAAFATSFGQTTQMPKWAFNGKQIDFTQTTPQVQNMNSSLSNPRFLSNAYYGSSADNYPLLFHIIDNEVYWDNGNFGGNLFVDADDVEDQMIPEMIIAPKDTMLCGNDPYYAFYVQVIFDGEEDKADSPLMSVVVSLSEIIPSQSVGNMGTDTILQTYGGDINVGIALSDFIPGTQTRRLYTVYRYGIHGGESKILKYDVTPSGLSSPVTIDSSSYYYYWEPSEVELSPGNDKLVFVRPKKLHNVYHNNTNDITIVYLDTASGNLSSMSSYDLEEHSSIYDRYVGLELDTSGNYAYVVKEDEKMLKVDLNNGNTTNLDDIDDFNEFNTQLERARNGLIYAVKSNGEVYYINETYNTIVESQLDLTSSGVIRNKFLYGDGFGNEVYTIPDQIDGCPYDDMFGSVEECCYIDLYTPADDAMQGVQIQTSGNERDIIIQSGNSVTWTPGNNSFGGVAEAYMEPGDIIIEPGASLTIEDMVIHFREGYEVQMDDNPSGVGSRLTLDNTTLTVFDECETAAMWEGIDLSGDWSSSQQPYSSSKQPYLKMSGNSKIEYADEGVEAVQGGFIRSFNSQFINNEVGASITGFNDQHSYFENCQFIINDDLYQMKNTIPSIHLHLWSADGVLVKGCEFYNNATSQMTPRGDGIVATYTEFDVMGRCTNPFCTSYDYNNFENLHYGIKAGGADNIVIDRTNFVDNVGGSWIIDCNALQFTRNDLDVYDYDENSSNLYETYGLYLESCSGYQVEENDFHDGKLGLVVFNSGTNVNEIYYNDFYDLTGNSVATACVNMGINTYYPTNKYTGLRYICNDFNEVDYGITITGGDIWTENNGLVTVDTSDIAKTQVYNLNNNVVQSAKNTFWLYTCQTGDERDFYVDESSSQIIQNGQKYSYYGSTDNLSNRDAIINCYNLSEVDRYYLGTFTTRDQECPSNLGGLIPFPMGALDGQTQKEDSLEAEYAALTEDVNELELIIAAQTASDNNTQEVHNKLMESSPYLTDTILKSYLLNNNANELSRTGVMLANSPLPESVKGKVDDSNIDPALKHYILSYQEGVNQLEALETEIESVKASQQYLIDRIHISYLKTDSSGVRHEWEQKLQSLDGNYSKRKLAELYISEGKYQMAENLLYDLASTYEQEGSSEMLKQIKLEQIGLKLKRSEDNAFLNSEDESYLYQLAEDYNSKSGGQARFLLSSAGLATYYPIVKMPNPNSPKSMTINHSQDADTAYSDYALEQYFEIYPNPVSEHLAVEFIVPESSSSFIIYDMQGRLVKQIDNDLSLGYVSVDVSDMEAGNYIIYCPQLDKKKQFVVRR